ncbi:hypothetical protein C0J52_13667 [Blattella germanica]|nr:hypothetical protein C0J52_13667 [Blattella germanica]PSN51202.1 hypothetical protein C0J52_13667 [Blattella germanica]PSN51203.1 hypothetical protein C0J52_13667 [Blattella germanica]
MCDECPGTYLIADDLAISLADTSDNFLVSKLHVITFTVIEWCDANKLSLNNDKTVDLNYDLSRKSHDPDKGVKFLGIHLEPDLGWLSHINCIVVKVSKSLFALRILRRTLGLSSLITAYYAFVHNHLNYDILIWGNQPRTGKLLILQKSAVRIIDGASSRYHSRPLFIKYIILILPSLYFELSIVCKNKLENFAMNSDCHDHMTRNKNDLQIIKKNKYIVIKNRFHSISIKLFNS